MSVIPPAPDYACTIADVAALIRARTKDSNGNELGIFTADTRPTDLQCQEAIDHQVALVHTKVGYIGDECVDVARGAVAIGAAAEIELSYYPDQIRTDRSPYPYLIARYDLALDGVAQCVAGNLPDSATDPEGQAVRFGTLPAISGTVAAYYGGQAWPALPIPLPPDPDEVP